MIYISIKVNIIHIFHMNIRSLITFLHGRFVHIHTFFHYKMMCGCRLRTCLYYIRQTSYERRLHRSHVSPPVPIWAEFISTIGTRYAMGDSSHHACPEPRRAAAIICRHILLGENLHNLIRTRAHEKNPVDFFRVQPLYALYIAGKNVKIVRCACTCARSTPRFFTSFEQSMVEKHRN